MLDRARLAAEESVQVGSGAITSASVERMADLAAVEDRLPGSGVGCDTVVAG